MEEVEFWRDPEKQGWMQCQGEIIKSWRRRWFVLKQGFLFRFAGPDVNSSSKPRGVVDLSKVTNVSDAREATGRPNSLKLSTETGHVAYICDGETEMVEWFSALEQAVKEIVKKVRLYPLTTASWHSICTYSPRTKSFIHLSISSSLADRNVVTLAFALSMRMCVKD